MIELENMGDPAAEATTARVTGLQSMSDDELDALESGKPAEEEAPAAPEVESAPEENPETPEATPEKEPTELELENQLLRARVEESEAENRRLNSHLGEHGGRIGFLERRLQMLSDQPNPAPTRRPTPAGEETEAEDYRQPAPVAEPRTDRYGEFLARQIVRQSVSEFLAQHPDVGAADAPDPLFGRVVEQWVKPRIMRVVQSGDPEYIEESTRQILDTAYHTFSRDRARGQREAIERRRADQSAKLRERKTATEVVGSAPAKPGPARPKTIMEASDAELDQFLDRHYGGR